jgi:hypothetical protein
LRLSDRCLFEYAAIEPVANEVKHGIGMELGNQGPVWLDTSTH